MLFLVPGAILGCFFVEVSNSSLDSVDLFLCLLDLLMVECASVVFVVLVVWVRVFLVLFSSFLCLGQSLLRCGKGWRLGCQG